MDTFYMQSGVQDRVDAGLALPDSIDFWPSLDVLACNRLPLNKIMVETASFFLQKRAAEGNGKERNVWWCSIPS